MAGLFLPIAVSSATVVDKPPITLPSFHNFVFMALGGEAVDHSNFLSCVPPTPISSPAVLSMVPFPLVYVVSTRSLPVELNVCSGNQMKKRGWWHEGEVFPS